MGGGATPPTPPFRVGTVRAREQETHLRLGHGEVLRSGCSLRPGSKFVVLASSDRVWALYSSRMFLSESVGQDSARMRRGTCVFCVFAADLCTRCVYPYMSLSPPPCLHVCVYMYVEEKGEQRSGLRTSRPVDFPNLSIKGVPSPHRARG